MKNKLVWLVGLLGFIVFTTLSHGTIKSWSNVAVFDSSYTITNDQASRLGDATGNVYLHAITISSTVTCFEAFDNYASTTAATKRVCITKVVKDGDAKSSQYFFDIMFSSGLLYNVMGNTVGTGGMTIHYLKNTW